MAMQGKFISLNLVPKQDNYKPILCIVSTRIVLHQWKKKTEKFPTLIFIITYEKKQSNIKNNWVLATAIKNALEKFNQ